VASFDDRRRPPHHLPRFPTRSAVSALAGAIFGGAETQTIWRSGVATKPTLTTSGGPILVHIQPRTQLGHRGAAASASGGQRHRHRDAVLQRPRRPDVCAGAWDVTAVVAATAADDAKLAGADLPEIPDEIPIMHFRDALQLVGADPDEPDLAPAYRMIIGTGCGMSGLGAGAVIGAVASAGKVPIGLGLGVWQ
jgi:hypothetical protein